MVKNPPEETSVGKRPPLARNVRLGQRSDSEPDIVMASQKLWMSGAEQLLVSITKVLRLGRARTRDASVPGDADVLKSSANLVRQQDKRCTKESTLNPPTQRQNFEGRCCDVGQEITLLEVKLAKTRKYGHSGIVMKFRVSVKARAHSARLGAAGEMTIRLSG